MWKLYQHQLSDDEIFDRIYDKLELYIGEPTAYTDIRDDIEEVLRLGRVDNYRRVAHETKIVVVNSEIIVTLPLDSYGNIGIDNELEIGNRGN